MIVVVLDEKADGFDPCGRVFSWLAGRLGCLAGPGKAIAIASFAFWRKAH